MKHKHTFALHSFLPAAFGRETEQATAGSRFLNCQSWIHREFSAWVSILDPLVTVPTWGGTNPSHITPELSRTDIYLLPCSVSCVWQYPILVFHQHFPWIITNFPQKAVCWNRPKPMLCLHFSGAAWLVFRFLPSSRSVQTPWAQQQTALNEPAIFSDNIFVIKHLAVLIFHSLTAWFIASRSLPVETSTPVDG